MAATTIEPAPEANERPAVKTKGESTPLAAEPVATRTYWRAVVRTAGGPVSISRDRDRGPSRWALRDRRRVRPVRRTGRQRSCRGGAERDLTARFVTVRVTLRV